MVGYAKKWDKWGKRVNWKTRRRVRYLQVEENAVYFFSLLNLIVSLSRSSFVSANLILVDDSLATTFGMPMNSAGKPVGATIVAVVRFFYGLKSLGFVLVIPNSELAVFVGG